MFTHSKAIKPNSSVKPDHNHEVPVKPGTNWVRLGSKPVGIPMNRKNPIGSKWKPNSWLFPINNSGSRLQPISIIKLHLDDDDVPFWRGCCDVLRSRFVLFFVLFRFQRRVALIAIRIFFGFFWFLLNLFFFCASDSFRKSRPVNGVRAASSETTVGYSRRKPGKTQ